MSPAARFTFTVLSVLAAVGVVALVVGLLSKWRPR